MNKPKAAVVGMHLYGYGGGAVAQLAIIEGLVDLGYRVDVYARMPIQPMLAMRLGRNGVTVQQHYLGCARGYDLLVNVDHFTYEPPLAKVNLAHVFHPHYGNVPEGVADKYRFSANSRYTSGWIAHEWNITAPHLYVPIELDPAPRLKEQMILHVSRFSRPTDLADKGHMQMIQAMRSLVEAGADDWELVLAGQLEDIDYFQVLQAMARRLPIRFVVDPPEHVLADLYARACVYWHMTGVSLPNVHGAQEHLGLTTVEAMTTGAVPIVLGTGGQPEIVTDNKTGRLAQNTNEIVRFTLDTISNLSVWSRLSQAAMRAARPWLDWNAWLQRLAAWIADTLPPELPAVVQPVSEFTTNDVCIVIPTRGANKLLDSLRTLRRRTASDVQVLVIDNCPEPLVLPDDLAGFAQVVRPPEPLNFSESNRIALDYTERAVLVAMNDDVLHIEDAWLPSLLASLTGDIGVVGAKLLYPDGRLQHAGGRLDWNRSDIGYHYLYGEPDQPAANQAAYVPFVTGALMAVRRELWEWPSWSGWGYEDTHLCLQAAVNGWRVLYQPMARALHFEGVSRSEASTNAEATQANRQKFIDRWYITYQNLPWLWQGGARYWRPA